MRYKTPDAFRTALETRLLSAAAGREPVLLRLRRIVTFERLLARIQAGGGDHWVLKGGFALQLRLGVRARTTRDVDLAADASPERLGDLLVEAASRDLGDHFVYEINPARQLPIDAGPVHAYRFSVHALLGQKTFERFHLDVGVGDPLVAPAVDLPATGNLDFAELPPVLFRVVSAEQHFAEKIHALTRPHGTRENTRVRDLSDLMLLMDLGLPDPEAVKHAVSAIFDLYKIQPVPMELADPPAAWKAEHAVLAEALELKERTVEAAMARLRATWRELGW